MKKGEVEREAKVKQFLRLLISYNDFHQASQIASYILKHKLQEKVERLRGERRYRIKLLWQALNCATVVAYCRPFSGNDRRTANRVPDLSARWSRRYAGYHTMGSGENEGVESAAPLAAPDRFGLRCNTKPRGPEER